VYDIKELIAEKKRRKALADVNDFMEYSYTDPETGHSFKQAEIHRAMHRHIDANQYSLIIFPRYFGKTSQLLGRMLYDLGNNHNEKMKIISSSDPVARKRVKAQRENITKNEKIQKIFPTLKPDETADTWSKSELTVARDIKDPEPSIEGCGILSTGLGGRATKLYFDDVCSYRNTIKVPALRSAVKEAFMEVWMNLLGPDGKAVYIATLLHQDDLTHVLLESEKWKKLMFAVGKNGEGYESPWPDKWSPKRLKEREKLIGTKAFDRNFRNKALSEEDVLFDPEFLKAAEVAGVGPLNPMFKKMKKYVGVDLAISEASRAHYTVIFEIAVENNIRYPLKILRGKWSSPQTAQLLATLNDADHPDAFCVENNGYQKSLTQWMRAIGINLPVIPYTTGLNKVDLNLGLPSIALEFESALWKIPMGDKQHGATCSCQFCIWIDEMKNYPIGRFDDTVLACLFAREAFRQASSAKFSGFTSWDIR